MSFPKYSIVFGVFGGLISGPVGWIVTGVGIALDVREKYLQIQCDKEVNKVMLYIASTPYGKRIIKEEIEKLKFQDN